MRLFAWIILTLSMVGGLVAQDPTAEGLLRDGLVALQGEDLPTARSKLEAAAKIDPADGRIWLGLAQVYRLLDDTDRSEEAITSTLELADEQPELLRGLAFYFDQADDPGRAAKASAQYARNYPDDPEPFQTAAAYYLEDGQTHLAVEFALSALERRKTAETYNVLGKAYADRGNFDQALTALREAVSLQRYSETLHVDLGEALLKAERFEDALRAFEAAREVFDKSAAIEFGLGRSFHSLNRFEQAAAHLERSLELDPKDDAPRELLAKVRAELGESSVAQESR